MAATVRVPSPGTARNNISGKVSVEIRRRMEAAGRLMVGDANTAMAGRFDLQRPFERRRSPGSARAANAIDFTIEGGPELPLRLGFRVKGGDEVVKRIIFMNFGTAPHRIYGGTDTWPLKGQFNITRTSRNFGQSGTRKPELLAWVGGGEDVFALEVDHPGQPATHFLEAALQTAIERMQRG